MTTQTRNEAAERLRTFGTYVKSRYIEHDYRSDIDEALAAERRATVERIREQAIASDLPTYLKGGYVSVPRLDEILRKEAQR